MNALHPDREEMEEESNGSSRMLVFRLLMIQTRQDSNPHRYQLLVAVSNTLDMHPQNAKSTVGMAVVGHMLKGDPQSRSACHAHH